MTFSLAKKGYFPTDKLYPSGINSVMTLTLSDTKPSLSG